MTSLEILDLSGYNLSDQQAKNFRILLNMIPSLSELRLSYCGLHNTSLSPKFLNYSTISKIQSLDLSMNSFEGKFPSFLTNFSSLRILDLSSNSLNSSIPVMKSLLKLNLQSNSFDHFEHAGIWSQCYLKWLDLSFNHFQDEIIMPSSHLSKCDRYDLEMLDLSSNEFSGSIPETLETFTQLRSLNLRFNSFTGPIPKSIGNLSLLKVLNLQSNILTGPIPASLGKLTALEELCLDHNLLSGHIPTYLGKLTDLEVLSIHSNKLTGPIPESLGQMVSLKDFLVSSNLLIGAIPASLGHLGKLTVFDVSNNSLDDFVSETHFVNLSMLKYLDASSNFKLTFNISREWIPPFQLRYLSLSSCNIAAEFPHWIRTQMILKELELSNAKILGPLPRWFRDMPIIFRLDLSHNLLSGPLTNLPSIDKWKGIASVHLEYLFLQNNLFSGSIPMSLCRRIHLRLLDFSRNSLSGELPECLGKLHDMYVMILSFNRLSGVIPSSLGRISSLQWLQLNNNNFHGELPLSLGNNSELRVVDLGENEFFGSIPNWLGKNLTNLRVLRLHKNGFSGSIPGELCRNSHIQILDFANNGLTGTIPHCFKDFAGMSSPDNEFFISPIKFEQTMEVVMKGMVLQYTKTMRYVVNMDLSSNNLIEEIPKELTSLLGLVGLNLSHNNLSGSIPDGIGDMKSLISLDLSVNKLSGIIPPSLGALTSLSQLNLSHNDLSGRIPTGNQLQTLIDPSIYEGNRELCGPPLPIDCSNDEDSATRNGNEKDKAGDDLKTVWFYLNIMSGFATGFWGIIGVLYFSSRWRQVLFRFVEVAVDKMYVAIAVRVLKVQRKRARTT